ncbi:MAG: thioredoxin-like domain-containing protein [Opitutus sp.]
MVPTLRLLVLTALLPLTVSAAVETWITNGTAIKAECLGRKGDYVVFKKTDGTRMLFPLAQLSGADKTRVTGLEFKTPATTFTVAPAKISDFSRIATALNGKLVGLNGRAVRALPPEHLTGTTMYAVYFSASWCGPCRRFTPELVAAYPAIKAAHPEFEVIFVSADEDETAMKHYMVDDHMPWTALRFGEAETNPTLARYRQSGIPNLVFIDGEGHILSKSYDDRGQYLGPQKVLSDIRRHFRM